MNSKGTGLGLSICKSIIEQMGGSVTVHSTEGVGTKFTIALNLKFHHCPLFEDRITPEFTSLFTMAEPDDRF